MCHFIDNRLQKILYKEKKFLAITTESRKIIKNTNFLSKKLILKVNNLKSINILKKCYLNKFFNNLI